MSLAAFFDPDEVVLGMTTCPRQLEHRRPRAPQEDRTVLVDPPFERIGRLVQQNLNNRSTWDYDVQGRPLGELCQEARAELIAEARRWTAAYRDVDVLPEAAEGLVFLAGHQPGLFHPGVWLKNFALGRIARRHHATAVNLLVDSDTVKRTMVKVPSGSTEQQHVELVPFDRSKPKVPYEERQIVDRRQFDAFGDRVAEAIAPLVADPLVQSYWPLARERGRATGHLGASLAQSRHQLEGQWGWQTLEVPQSRVCSTRPFLWFLVHLLAELPRLRTVYNEAVEEYRSAHRIRNAAHPVPNLAAADPWLEAPLWIWTAEQPHRRPLFARSRRDEILLSDGRGFEAALPLDARGDAAWAVDRLEALGRDGVKIRSRALITTLWARLALGDLFFHGIGGAKYDQVTDLIFERFFRMELPGFVLLSATLQLPVERPDASPGEVREIQRELRDLTYNPQRHIDPERGSAASEQNPAELVASKQRWIDTPQTRENARARCRNIRRINEALRPFVADRREQLERRQEELDKALRAKNILTSREYSFCLFPEETLRGFFGELLPGP